MEVEGKVEGKAEGKVEGKVGEKVEGKGVVVEQEKEKKKGVEEKEGTKEQPATYIPAFSPAEPVTVRSYGNHDITISQDNDQLWYIQNDYLGPIPILVVVCEGCGFGYPVGKYFSYGVKNFTRGRTISSAQPRMTGTCDMCGWC